MPTEIKLPELSENAKEGKVTALLVKTGDVVTADQSLLEVEAGKATVEIPSPLAGTVAALKVKEGDMVQVGRVIMTIEESSAPAASRQEAKKDAKPSPVSAEPEAGTPAPSQPASPAAPPRAPAPPATIASAPGNSSAAVPASPTTRQFAREIGVDINAVAGSGPGGRVSSDDVKRFSREVHAGFAAGGQGGRPATPPLPDFSRFGEIGEEPLSGVRLATAQHMSLSWSSVPHVTIHDSVDITAIEALRKASREKAEAAGTKLTLTAFLIKIMAAALNVHPKFNSSLDLANNRLVLKKYINIGVAMDTERGLVVPVIRNANSLNVIKIAQAIGQLAERAKAGKISPDDMQGGGMTITNIGALAGSYFTPIVNYPEVAILGVGRATSQPVLVDGFFQPRLMLPLSLSFDHRVIDGADGARFLAWIGDTIKQPVLLSVEG